MRNETRQERNGYGILRTPAHSTGSPRRAVTHKVAVPLTPPPEDVTPEEQLLDEVCALEACATQYENLWAAGLALTALGRLKERIPADMRAHVVTTCLYAAAGRVEDATWPALRARRDRARDALRSLRSLAPAELVWEIDELLETGEWNTEKRFPQTA